MRATTLSLDMTVDEALARWPELSKVFLRHQMACAGCAMAPFERLSDVARSYRLSSARFLRELRARLLEERR
jgi:hybrid cluster-associated redox disulfide protein